MGIGLLLMVFLAGCSPTAGSAPAASPTSAPTTSPATTAPTPRPTPAPTPTVTLGRPFAVFLRTICDAFASRNASVIVGLLPYYQYNSGLRWGYLGDGEGQTSDPSLMQTWLADSHPHCISFTPGYNAHGTVLTVGWRSPGPAALLDLDIFSGHWKINDFTFGTLPALSVAMHTSSPIVRYRGQ